MRRGVALLMILGLIAVVAAVAWTRPVMLGQTSFRSIAVFGTLPIFWRESDRVSDLLATDAARHWAVPVLEQAGPVRPLDTLADAGSLDGLDALVMAQPRPLSPEENVALDEWVRGGGRVLLFADPMLTAHSDFALGDKRRPQDVVLLSPILGRWGLRLKFDEDQPSEERRVGVDGVAVPVRLAGRLTRLTPASSCRTAGEGLLADCRIGRGRVLVLADAAMLEDLPESAEREQALSALLDRLAGT